MNEEQKAKITTAICSFTVAIIFLFQYLYKRELFTALSIIGMILFIIIFILLKCAKGEYGRSEDLDKFTIPIWVSFWISFAFLICLCMYTPDAGKYIEIFGMAFLFGCFGVGLLAIVAIGMGGG